MQTLEDRVKHLEELVALISKGDTILLAGETQQRAQWMALYSVVQDLAEHAGVPPDKFLAHFQLRFAWWLQRKLNRAEDIDPAKAAELSALIPGEPSDGEPYPSIFDPPPDS